MPKVCSVIISPLNTKIILHFQRFSSDLTENKMCFLSKDQSLNAVQGNKHCLLLKLYQTRTAWRRSTTLGDKPGGADPGGRAV